MDILVGAVAGFGIVVGGIVVAPTVKMAVDVAPFLYTNTRCAAKSGMILQKKDYDSLVSAVSLREVFTLIEDTSYASVVEHGADFSKISTLLDKDLFETYNWLSGVMPDKIKPIFSAMMLKFEINQMKEVLNNIEEGKEQGELNYVIDPSLKLKLEGANDMNSFSAALEGTVYEEVFRGKEIKNAADVNTELDKFYLSHVMRVIDNIKDKAAAKPFRDYWKIMIDLANIRLTLRKIDSKDENVKLVSDGTLDESKLISANEMNQVEELLANTKYKEFITESDSFGIENAFFRFMKKQAGTFSAKFPLKGGPIIQFLINKEIEIRNLNVVVKLKSEDFKGEEISKVLVI